MQTTIERAVPFFRPLTHEGKEFERIVFYDNGEKYLTIDRGWLENNSTEDRKSGRSRGDDVVKLALPTEIKRANKENLTRSDCYYLKGRRDYSFDKAYTLYIPVKPIDLGEFPAFETNNQRTYYRAWNIPLAGVTRDALRNESELSEICEVVYSRSELTTLGEQAQRIAQDWKQRFRVDISESSLADILGAYDITPKQ